MRIYKNLPLFVLVSTRNKACMAESGPVVVESHKWRDSARERTSYHMENGGKVLEVSGRREWFSRPKRDASSNEGRASLFARVLISSSLSLYLHSFHHLLFTTTHDMADPSGAPSGPGPNDTSTAILRPKKSCVQSVQGIMALLT